jgi:SHS2 domain-containing protein
LDKGFELLEHTADIGVMAYGSDLKQAFANAARGMLSIITDPDEVNEVESRPIDARASNTEDLLVAWLNELVYIFDVENLLLKSFKISELDENHIKATGYGEKVDTSRHEMKAGIKAVTYHMLEVARQDDGYRVRVIFDV